jgi:hypothetical protein
MSKNIAPTKTRDSAAKAKGNSGTDTKDIRPQDWADNQRSNGLRENQKLFFVVDFHSQTISQQSHDACRRSAG